MGRLPSLSALLLTGLALASCEEDKKKAALSLAPTARSEVVEAVGTSPVAPPVTTPTAPKGPRAPRRLCDGQLTKAGRDLPRKATSRLAAPGAKSASPAIAAPGQWTWVNLWAAWCAPCKEEMPRLRAMSARLARTPSPLALSFLSLDDDERQLEQFLAAQPADGLRATFWLHEGRERDEWLAESGLGKDPQLPLQLVVDPRGKIRCVVSGAVEDDDYAEIASIVAK